MSEEDILAAVNAEISTWEEIYLDTNIYGKDCTNLLLKEHVESMVCSDYSNPKVLSIILVVFCIVTEPYFVLVPNIYTNISYYIQFIQREKIYIQEAVFKFYVYSLTQEMAATETLQSDSEEFSVASHWVLPSQEFHHIWQNLFYDNDIKNDVSKFIYICI